MEDADNKSNMYDGLISIASVGLDWQDLVFLLFLLAIPVWPPPCLQH